jgi:phage repressor protein C with HTH and peptisase S24 domain
MFTHGDVWRGIDLLAKHHGLTASGLARRAGLDPTTFNPSKRVTKQSKLRWPSTESLAKILDATSTPFEDFVALMAERPAGRTRWRFGERP